MSNNSLQTSDTGLSASAWSQPGACVRPPPQSNSSELDGSSAHGFGHPFLECYFKVSLQLFFSSGEEICPGRKGPPSHMVHRQEWDPDQVCLTLYRPNPLHLRGPFHQGLHSALLPFQYSRLKKKKISPSSLSQMPLLPGSLPILLNCAKFLSLYHVTLCPLPGLFSHVLL